jgi:four helix bundle protein
MGQEYVAIEDTDCFRLSESLSDTIWSLVVTWNHFAQDTIGKQLIRAVDSIGANMAEGAGRYSYAEEIRFFIIARGSAREAGFWIRRAIAREILTAEKAQPLLLDLQTVSRQLNALIAYRRKQQTNARETPETYTPNPIDPIDPMT